MSTLEHLGDGRQDFDFLFGDWIVRNRRLPNPLEGSDAWETFEATQRCQPLPGGIGNYDNFIAESWRPGYVGMSLRIFNPTTRRWSIYWLNNRDGGIDAATGALSVPVVGEFQNGVGVFEADDVFGGKPIRVRYTWSHISDTSARWQQAFSVDRGQTWEVNWIMEMTRNDLAHCEHSI
ncbi:MAG: hypothetical protein ABL985_08010 [Casimicrobium sp.]